MERFTFSISGQVFSISKDAIFQGPYTRVTEVCRRHKGATPIIIDRPPEMFLAILSLYQTGSLHIPNSSCPGAFLEEMDFWDIKQEMLTTCCFYRLQCFLNEEENLKKFRRKVFGDDEDDVSTMSVALCSALERLRRKVWAVVDYRERTLLSRLYFTVALVMVLVSLITIALSTDDMFQRTMNNCERLEYMESTEMPDLELIAGILKTNCDGDIPFERVEDTVFQLNVGPNNDVKASDDEDFVYYLVYNTQATPTKPPTVDYTEPTPQAMYLKEAKKIIRIPNMKVPMYILVVMDMVTLIFFTAEFILRLLSCPSILHYFFSVINVADASALIGTYLHMLLMHFYAHAKYKDDWMDILLYMQMLRSLRLFRIVKNVKASRVLAYSVGNNIKDLSVLMLFLVVGVCTFASIMYIPENKLSIKSIPVGWYWAIVTMTTVGYGDITPNTAVGKAVGCLCAVSGVLLFALTVPIFANNFVTLYQYAGIETVVAKKKEQKNKQKTLDLLSVRELNDEKLCAHSSTSSLPLAE